VLVCKLKLGIFGMFWVYHGDSRTSCPRSDAKASEIWQLLYSGEVDGEGRANQTLQAL